MRLSLFQRQERTVGLLGSHFFGKRIHDSILKAESIYWIAFYDSIPVGYAKVKLDFTIQLIIPPKTCYLGKIYVVKKFISKEIGKELHKFLMQEIIALKYQRIWLSVLRENQRAINFYHKKGYQIISQYSQNIGSQKFEFLVMALNLDEKAT